MSEWRWLVQPFTTAEGVDMVGFLFCDDEHYLASEGVATLRELEDGVRARGTFVTAYPASRGIVAALRLSGATVVVLPPPKVLPWQ